MTAALSIPGVLSRLFQASGRSVPWVILTFISFIALPVRGQDRCSIIRYEEILQQHYPNRENRDRFERWMSDQSRKPGTSIMQTGSTYTIPVVVHIINNGEATGSGTNISDAQVLSQIEVINKDFKRLNNDATQTPSEFTGVAGSISLDFVLARRDPNGQQSTGIVRINGGKAQWSLNEEIDFKSRSYWPAEDYLNIWVLDLSGTDIGYSTFPLSGLPGLEGIPDQRLLDGIVVDYRAFGSKDYGSFNLDPKFNTGRTATHEIGHFLGLRHIWGDGSSCNATDYVTDTPPQIGETTGCPAHPQVECSGLAKMFQNFMDYTDDQCMNLFTQKQVERMVIVLGNSPRRTSLTTSLGGISPNYSLEAALRIVSPKTEGCPGSIQPVANLLNLGSTVITKATVELKINGTSSGTYTFSINVPKDSNADLVFPAVNLVSGNTSTFQFLLKNVNDQTDEYSPNNDPQLTSRTATSVALPFSEEMDALPANWTVVNPDGGYTWVHSDVRSGSLTLPGYDYQETGAQDLLFSPVFSATAATRILMQFDVAYARYPGNNEESLSVYVIEDCNISVQQATRIYYKQGSELATAPDDNSPFVPVEQQWRRESIVLNSYAGKPNLRLAFVFRNAFGNNLYLDRVRVLTGDLTDLRVAEVVEPSVAVCSNSIKPRLRLVNAGTVPITSVTVTPTLNKALGAPFNVSLSLNAGAEEILDMPVLNIPEGPSELSYDITTSQPDINMEDNGISKGITMIARKDRIPARERFDGIPNWTIAPEGGFKTWEFSTTNFGGSAKYNAYSNAGAGERAWLVSPALDFSKANAASLFGDFSYADRSGSMEKVKIAASLDCGATFPVVLFDGDADELNSNNSSSISWEPTADSDWTRNFFDLSELAGKKDILVAMVVTNDNGNNLFADNLEFFAGDDPEPVRIERQFQIYTEAVTREERITFNLEERQAVRLQIYTSTGLPVLDNTYDDILNQTLVFQLNRPSGIYIYRLQIGGKTYSAGHFVP